MKSDIDQPLWRKAIPDREPWRRGRVAVVLISLLIFIGQTALVLASLVEGDLTSFLSRLLGGWFVCIFLFLMWIGQNWARWIVAPVFGLAGAWACVWGIGWENGLLFLIGLGNLAVFSYLAIAPSIYAFARHQREHASLFQSLAIGAVFLLVFVSLGSGLFAFYAYQNALERECAEFAQKAFHRVFIDHEVEYLATHSSKEKKHSSPQAFIDRTQNELGAIAFVGPAGAKFTSRLVDWHLEMKGVFRQRVSFTDGNVWVVMTISRADAAWQIDHISWEW